MQSDKVTTPPHWVARDYDSPALPTMHIVAFNLAVRTLPGGIAPGFSFSLPKEQTGGF